MSPSCVLMLTCCVGEAVGVPGVLAAVGVSTLQSQLHGGREGPVPDLVGGRDLHQVDVPRLQLLQQGHGMASCQEVHTAKIRNTANLY